MEETISRKSDSSPKRKQEDESPSHDLQHMPKSNLSPRAIQ